MVDDEDASDILLDPGVVLLTPLVMGKGGD